MPRRRIARPGLVQDTNGEFYGTAEEGGGYNTNCAFYDVAGCGTVFRLSTGLKAFVRPLTASGEVGSTTGILGSGLNGATPITFEGIPTVFKAIAQSAITVVVPESAATAYIRVVTPTGTLSTKCRSVCDSNRAIRRNTSS